MAEEKHLTIFLALTFLPTHQSIREPVRLGSRELVPVDWSCSAVDKPILIMATASLEHLCFFPSPFSLPAWPSTLLKALLGTVVSSWFYSYLNECWVPSKEITRLFCHRWGIVFWRGYASSPGWLHAHSLRWMWEDLELSSSEDVEPLSVILTLIFWEPSWGVGQHDLFLCRVSHFIIFKGLLTPYWCFFNRHHSCSMLGPKSAAMRLAISPEPVF